MNETLKKTTQPAKLLQQLTEVGGRIGTNRYTSESLFLGKNELCISHGEEEYRLRITKQGKLILTK